jgi:hypothetical protein
VALCGAVPLAFVGYCTAPFVALIHVRLPPFARQSREMLGRFARNAPGSTRLDVTTMSIVGRPRTSVVAVSDLYPVRRRFGMVNYARDSADAGPPPPRWRLQRPSADKFSIQGHGAENVSNGWVWKEIANGIERRRAPP